jgi:hypothetical protein
MSQVTVIDVADPSAFDACVAAHLDDTNLYVLVSGAKDETTGKSWFVRSFCRLFLLKHNVNQSKRVDVFRCPDCESAEPVIHAALNGLEAPVTLIYAPVVRSEYRGNASHPYRVHPQLKLKAVPTLYRWAGKRGPSRSLVEGECLDSEMMAALLE